MLYELILLGSLPPLIEKLFFMKSRLGELQANQSVDQKSEYTTNLLRENCNNIDKKSPMKGHDDNKPHNLLQKLGYVVFKKSRPTTSRIISVKMRTIFIS